MTLSKRFGLKIPLVFLLQRLVSMSLWLKAGKPEAIAGFLILLRRSRELEL
jgi:hypothetical protein